MKCVYVSVLARVSRKTEPIGCIYIQEDLLAGTGSCDLGGWQIPRSAVDNLDTQERAHGVVPVWVQRPQECQWCKSQPEGRRPMSHLKQLCREWILPSFAFLFESGPTDWMMPTHSGEGNLLYSVYRFKGDSETPSQTHSELVFNQIAGCPVTQSSHHKINHHK